jgi:hypothetical protein
MVSQLPDVGDEKDARGIIFVELSRHSKMNVVERVEDMLASICTALRCVYMQPSRLRCIHNTCI